MIVRREHPPVTLTCAHLYETDTTFRLLVDEWVRERRCPLPLVDRCLDFGLDSAAEGARWAATEVRRKVYSPLIEYGEQDGKCGPYPSMGYTRGALPVHYYWTLGPRKNAADVPRGMRQLVKDGAFEGKTPQEAILWLLDNWRLEGVPE